MAFVAAGVTLLLVHAVNLGDKAFILLQAINTAAVSAVVLLLRKHARRVCGSCSTGHVE